MECICGIPSLLFCPQLTQFSQQVHTVTGCTMTHIQSNIYWTSYLILTLIAFFCPSNLHNFFNYHITEIRLLQICSKELSLLMTEITPCLWTFSPGMSDSEGWKSLTKAIVTANTYQFVCKLLNQSLVKLPKHNTIQMFWMPGHMGNDGNEIAGKLSRQGSSHPLIGPERALGISAKVARGVIRGSGD